MIIRVREDTYVDIRREEIIGARWCNDRPPAIENGKYETAAETVPCSEILAVGFVRIEVVIVAVVRVDILIWVDSWVVPLGGAIDTIFPSACRARQWLSATICVL